MTEGELKKRLRYIQGLGHDSEAVIDEAKRDYPSLLSLGLVPKLSQYDIDKIDKARQDWFVKWFGK